MIDWSDTVFRRRNVTRRRISNTVLIPPSLKISESSSNGSYRNTDKVWWRYDEGTESAEVATNARFGPKYISTQKISTLFDALDEREIAR
jgi:hypothetical protein